MSHAWTRRTFVGLAPGVVVAGFAGARLGAAGQAPTSGPNAGDAAPGPHFPAQDPAVVLQVVGLSHSSLERVRELVTARPALAKATWDWGFGDWESALGAASHTGRREIAELLLSHGARPTIFSAAMLGQLAVVKAFIETSPGVESTPGPHDITLLSHARAGGPAAAAVVSYLESLEGANRRPATQPLDPAVRDAIVGEYAFGPGPDDRLVVDVNREVLGLTRAGGTRHNIFHLGDLAFYPVGARAVRVHFVSSGNRISHLTVHDGEIVITALRA